MPNLVALFFLLISLVTGSQPVQGLTYSEVVEFLEKDHTEKILYQPSVFVCWDFAELLQANAHQQGIRCAVVTLAWADSEKSHVINAFETVDHGLIWVDVTGSHSKEVEGYDRILEPKKAGDTYLYEETGGYSLEVTLKKVTYSWN
jgi:hypothetical protein